MDIHSENTSWMWGVSLIVLTVTIHVTGVVSLALAMIRIRLRLEVRHLGLLYVMPTVIGVIAVIGLLLTMLHMMEAAIWATSYLWLGVFDSSSNAILYSLGSMTTVGAPGLELPRPRQVMGVLEAANGALLFGISTAYIFGVMQVYWPLLHPRDRLPTQE
jgi:hypothetical protein